GKARTSVFPFERFQVLAHRASHLLEICSSRRGRVRSEFLPHREEDATDGSTVSSSAREELGRVQHVLSLVAELGTAFEELLQAVRIAVGDAIAQRRFVHGSETRPELLLERAHELGQTALDGSPARLL